LQKPILDHTGSNAMINITNPTKYELVRSLQKMNIHQIQVIEPYTQTDMKDFQKIMKQLNQKPGEVTVILVRTR
jgi:maleate cis-trans isomerase